MTKKVQKSVKLIITIMALSGSLPGCKPRQSNLSNEYSNYRDQSAEVQAMYYLMQRDYKEGETVFLHTNMFRISEGEVQEQYPPGFPTWNQMFQPFFKDLSPEKRLDMVFAYYNFFEEKQLEHPWNEWTDESKTVRKRFPLIHPSTSERIGSLFHYLLRAKVVKESKDPASQTFKREFIGNVEWLMDTEYAPEAVRMALLMATTPVFSPSNEVVANNFFEPFHIDLDATYRVLYWGLPRSYSPIYLEPCNNPGRPYRPAHQNPERAVNRFVPGSSREVVSVFNEVQREYQTFPYGSLMMAADNEHGATFLSGTDLGEYLWEPEENQAEVVSDVETKENESAKDLTGQGQVGQSPNMIDGIKKENSLFNSSMRKVIVTRLLINTQADITSTDIWAGKRRPIVIGYPSTEETKHAIRDVENRIKMGANILGHKYKIVDFEVVPYELKNLVLTRRFLPNLARRGCGGGTIVERLLEENGYNRIKLPDPNKQPQPMMPQGPSTSPFFPSNPGKSSESMDKGEERRLEDL